MVYVFMLVIIKIYDECIISVDYKQQEKHTSFVFEGDISAKNETI